MNHKENKLCAGKIHLFLFVFSTSGRAEIVLSRLPIRNTLADAYILAPNAFQMSATVTKKKEKKKALTLVLTT